MIVDPASKPLALPPQQSRFALGSPPRRTEAARNADVAQKFETLIAQTLLRSARAANLGDAGFSDGGFGSNSDTIRDMVDHHRAQAIARAAPLGVARLLAAETPAPPARAQTR